MRTTSSESGFSLVELAIVLGIAGLMLGGAMAMMKPYMDMAQRNTTITKQENIAKALANYAMMNGRLPCPGDPNPVSPEVYGTPRNSVGGTLTYVDCGGPTIGNFIGIVPFKVLGLSEDNVEDSYGNLMSYAVSPVLAGYDPASTPGADTTSTPPEKFSKIHASCRTDKWVDTVAVPNKNRNENKALLCCMRYYVSGANVQDLRVLESLNSTNPPLLASARLLNGTDVINTDYANANVLFTGAPAIALKPFIAYVLISHGKNGDGAYIGQTGNRKPATVAGGTTAQEWENRDVGDRDFASEPLRTTSDANYFDDIVLWRSNQQLVSEFGNDSCARP